MEQKFNLKISKPCSEKFNQFNKTKAGGFCNSCEKEVIDFRKMSDKELINYFTNKEHKTCGYFKTSQLKEYTQINEIRRTSKFKFLRIAAVAFISLTSLHHIQAQEQKPKSEIVQKSNEISNSQNNKSEVQEKLFSGTIFDESGPLPGANIVLKGTSIGTISNFDGEFEFPKTLKEGDILVVSFLGYTTQNILIGKEQAIVNLIMEEELSCVLMGEVEVNEVYESKPTFWQRIKKIF
ncbi:hypothetical protein DIS18_11985 [Algibacter marinivivus]|uniref:CarboxypepD_reg-like domain-containing protein n=1 Tax=Algibacter marinivivus TaxID=2100723 RepID=A0A2U2X2H7_9FLAO|nr:carboxypeptidase-like regulatory domain-containing protein [Algibacter marinivivus]PWH81982.1 hypothetical protein DIS18_11985 [Algibacter marinivivus]